MPATHAHARIERQVTPSVIEDRLLTNVETADALGVHPKSLTRARVYGGPLSLIPHLKIGRNVRYRLSEVERYLRLVSSNTVHDRIAG